MPLLAELLEIPASVQRDDFVLKLTNGVSDEAAAKTLSSYVVTPELAGKFDEALGFLKAALETGLSKATFLHGSFGSGVVVQIKGDELTVVFDKVGLKRLLESLAPLEAM